MRKDKFLAMLIIALLIMQPINLYAGDISYNSESDEKNEEVKLSVLSSELFEEAMQVESMSDSDCFVENQVFCHAESLEEAEKIAEHYEAELISYDENIAVLEIEGDIASVLREEAMSQSPNARIYPNYIMRSEETNDPFFSNQWYHKVINDTAAWNKNDGSGVIVGVVDTGIDTDHEDLKNKIYLADKCGRAATEEDEYGHGTHVAGIIASEAKNNVGGAGVAPGVEIYSVNVGNPASSTEYITTSSFLSGIKKAVNEGADVVNISLGFDYTPDSSTLEAMQEVFDYAYEMGTTVIASAGNTASSEYHYPAALEHVISVGASTRDGELAYYSAYGDWVDIVAPGSTIYSTVPGGGYGYKSGTSMAAPIVAGAAALIYASDKDLRDADDSSAVDEVTERLLAATDGKKYYYRNESRAVDGGCIDFSKLIDGSSNTGVSDNNEENTNNSEENNTNNNEEINNKEEQNNIENSEESESENRVVTVEITNGGEMTYNSCVNFGGRKLKVQDLDLTVSYDGMVYSLKKAKIINGKHAGTATVTIKKLNNADKKTNAIFKGLTFSVEIEPMTVSSTNVSCKKGKDGTVKKVYVNINGKNKKVKKTMYNYDSGNEAITFSGDFEGSVEL